MLKIIRGKQSWACDELSGMTENSPQALGFQSQFLRCASPGR